MPEELLKWGLLHFNCLNIIFKTTKHIKTKIISFHIKNVHECIYNLTLFINLLEIEQLLAHHN